MKPKVFVSRIIPDAGLKKVTAICEADIWQGELPPSYETLLGRVVGMDGLLCMLTDRIDAKLMDTAGSQLKVISQMAVGYDNIDVPACTRRRVVATHTPGVLDDTTADFAWTLLMAVARRLLEQQPLVPSLQSPRGHHAAAVPDARKNRIKRRKLRQETAERPPLVLHLTRVARGDRARMSNDLPLEKVGQEEADGDPRGRVAGGRG